MGWDSFFTPEDDKCQRCGHSRTAPIDAPDGKRKHSDDACPCGCTASFHRAESWARESES